MAEFIPINGKLLVYGMTWAAVSNVKKESTESTSFSRTYQAEYRVRYAGKEIKYGLVKRVLDTVGAQQRGVLLSAACLFSTYVADARATQNSLLVHQIDDRNVAIIALLDGAPYVDVVVSLGELDSQLASLKQEGHAAFVTYGNLPSHVRHLVSLADLMSGDSKPSVLVRFTDPRKRIQRVGMAVLVVVLIGGSILWKAEKEKRAADEAAKQVIDPVQEYRQATQQILTKANFNGEAAFEAIWQVIKQREIDVAGWSLKKITCKPMQCEELWQQTNGSFIALRQHTQLPQKISLQANGETSVITYPLSGRKTALEHSALPKIEALWIDLLSQQQRLKRINPALVFAPKPARIIGLSPTITASNIPADLLVYSGEISVSAPLGLAGEIFQHQLHHVTVNEVSIENIADIHRASINIKGTYYAQH